MYNESKTKQNHNKNLIVATQSFTYRCARSSSCTHNHHRHCAYDHHCAHLYVKL